MTRGARIASQYYVQGVRRAAVAMGRLGRTKLSAIPQVHRVLEAARRFSASSSDCEASHARVVMFVIIHKKGQRWARGVGAASGCQGGAHVSDGLCIVL
jgi:hypothetical protein